MDIEVVKGHSLSICEAFAEAERQDNRASILMYELHQAGASYRQVAWAVGLSTNAAYKRVQKGAQLKLLGHQAYGG